MRSVLRVIGDGTLYGHRRDCVGTAGKFRVQPLSGEPSPAGTVYSGSRSALPEAWLHPCDDRTLSYQTTDNQSACTATSFPLPNGTGIAPCARRRATTRASLSRAFTVDHRAVSRRIN